MRRLVMIAFILIAFLVAIYGIVVLPSTVPIHFDVYGNPDKYANKFTLLVLPLIALTVYLGIPLIFKIDPYANKIEPRKFVILAIRDVMVIFFSVISVIAVIGAYSEHISSNLIALLVSCLIVVIGNYMPKLPHNWFVGIRTPWTLIDENVWKKTHRLFGTLLFLWGFVMIVLSFISIKIWLWVMFVGVVFIILGAFIYSYMIYRKE